jgi:hypothetical protein
MRIRPHPQTGRDFRRRRCIIPEVRRQKAWRVRIPVSEQGMREDGKKSGMRFAVEVAIILALVLIVLIGVWIWLPEIAALGLKPETTREASKKVLIWCGPRAFGRLVEAQPCFNEMREADWMNLMGDLCEEANKSQRDSRRLAASLRDPDAIVYAGYHVLDVAAYKDLVCLAEALLAAGANPSIPDKVNETPLHQTCVNGSIHVARLLLENHADLNAADYTGATPLDWAHRYGREDIAALLRQHGAKTAAELKDYYDITGFYVFPLKDVKLGLGRAEVERVLGEPALKLTEDFRGPMRVALGGLPAFDEQWGYFEGLANNWVFFKGGKVAAAFREESDF